MSLTLVSTIKIALLWLLCQHLQNLDAQNTTN